MRMIPYLSWQYHDPFSICHPYSLTIDVTRASEKFRSKLGGWADGCVHASERARSSTLRYNYYRSLDEGFRWETAGYSLLISHHTLKIDRTWLESQSHFSMVAASWFFQTLQCFVRYVPRSLLWLSWCRHLTSQVSIMKSVDLTACRSEWMHQFNYLYAWFDIDVNFRSSSSSLIELLSWHHKSTTCKPLLMIQKLPHITLSLRAVSMYTRVSSLPDLFTYGTNCALHLLNDHHPCGHDGHGTGTVLQWWCLCIGYWMLPLMLSTQMMFSRIPTYICTNPVSLISYSVPVSTY